MASGGKVEIQVELEGGGKVQGALNKIGRGAEVAGGKAAQVGEALSASSNVMTASLGNVVSTVGTLTEGIGGLSTASKTAGASFVSMLGPIAAIGTAIFAVVQAVRQYVNNSQDLETRMEALKAAASEFTSVMERLADENITLTKAERQRLMQLTRVSKAQTEYIQKIREGEGVEGQRLQRVQKAFAQAQAEVDMIRKRTHTEAYFLQQSVAARARLRVATMNLNEAEEALDGMTQKAMQSRREQTQLVEKLIETRGRAALQKQQEAATKAVEDQLRANKQMLALGERFQREALSIEASTTSQRIALIRRELAERQRLLVESAASDQEYEKASWQAERVASAKIRALRKADRAQREAGRAQEAAARKAAADRAFADEQKLAEARIRLATKGIEQQRQLIELRFQSAQRAATTETQLETAQINRQRELMALEEKQEADRRAAEMQRIDALQRSIELTRQEAEALQMLANAPLDKVTAAVENFGQGLVFASLAALQSGESVSAAVGEALKAIALQAGVEAIMQTAKGTAALFTPGGQEEAAGHFKAAAFFGAAAIAAGSAGSALSASGGGGGGAGASPTGAAQSIRDRDFDRDEERGGVTINVNMGQAVIYDTKAAAERAFADRVVQAINTPRRGAVRLRGA
jgi:hypothetical protein